jgi:hypothetical protein
MTSSNPFNRALDDNLRGKYVEVSDTDGGRIRGWLDRIHHQRGSALLRDATDMTTGGDLGAAYIRITDSIRVIWPQTPIEYAPVDAIHPSPYHDSDTDTVARHLRGAYRDGFTGSFPVVRPHPERERAYELINGHRRIAACREVGCAFHPVEVVDATDAEARELVALEHDGETADACSGDAPEQEAEV